MGGQSPVGGLSAVNVAVCTIEKANGMVNRLIEEGRLDELGVVVVDELHLIGDAHRGYLLELLLTKLLVHSRRASKGYLEPIPAPKLDVQLSAETQLNAVDEDGVFGLCLDTMLTGHGVLVFCPTKQWCEQLADSMAKHIFQLTKAHFAAQNEPADNVVQCETIGSRLAAHLNRNGLVQCVEQLRRCPAGLDPALARCLGYAVAFHHAGRLRRKSALVFSLAS
ncbi:DNA polymerase theta [Fasciola gigantica]|uniref:DNA polymerase theta n=1 Tax=Fasciola gigantica TaxID=46835 RepID=A0A504YX97_FASGI|nr:DNA polymerase theta [Fasciola gigantica]